jgi:exodeoxyribonuclease-3
MKIIAWNVNGIRSLIKKNYLYKLIDDEKPSIICFSETKVSCPLIDIQIELEEKIKGYKHRYWSPCKIKGGYSGTAIFSKKKPINVFFGLKDKDNKELDDEGRIICLEFEKFFLLHCYTPNSGIELARLDFRTNIWDPAFKNYIIKLQKKKAVIVCGDLNVAHKEIDLKNPKTNTKTAGFTKEERDSFDKLLSETSLIDTYRELNPNRIDYSFWSYRFNSRKKDIGWRIDYFLINKKYIENIKKSLILTEILGSDHAPIKLEFKI